MSQKMKPLAFRVSERLFPGGICLPQKRINAIVTPHSGTAAASKFLSDGKAG